MKAVAYKEYGPPEVLKLTDVEKPVPRNGEVLVKVHATSVTAADTMMRRADSAISRIFLGLRRPRRRILGTELAGEIESVGKDVRRFRKGDRVYGVRPRAYAEYARMPEKGSLAPMPAALSYEEAAAVVDGASTALYFLRDRVPVRRGQKILVISASGSIGTFAVQLARHFGAEVTGVCSAANADMVRALGADRVIDYAREDFEHIGDTWDIIFDTVGKSSFSRCRSSLKKRGKLPRDDRRNEGVSPCFVDIYQRREEGRHRHVDPKDRSARFPERDH